MVADAGTDPFGAQPPGIAPPGGVPQPGGPPQPGMPAQGHMGQQGAAQAQPPPPPDFGSGAAPMQPTPGMPQQAGAPQGVPQPGTPLPQQQQPGVPQPGMQRGMPASGLPQQPGVAPPPEMAPQPGVQPGIAPGVPTQPPAGMQPQAPPAAMPSARPPQGDASGIYELLIHAGLDPASAQAYARPEYNQIFGQMLKIVLEGMIAVLRARTEIKGQFRVAMTQIKPHENNPLKFCVTSSDALTSLLGKQGQGFLGPVEAFQEGFEDLKAHQMAMMAGMRAAFDQLIGSFAPDSLQAEFDRDIKGGLLANKKTKYWEMFCELYADINRDSDANFRELFGDKFAQAYEAQMEMLAANRRNR